MLLLLEEPLKAAGFKTLRLDGTQNARQRAQVIEQFQLSKVDEPMILLASLKSSSTGINLTAASRVYLMEPWWNPAVEEQAMDRVHRIGQKEEVKIVRLIAKNSIEEKILQLQERKKEITSRGSGRRSNDIAGMGINDLRFVLGE
ncbi:SWI/SNF-related matrix-associated actin-dependent regulator of chromatin subfamily A member 3-like 1-like [Trifolium medium]|uniref:SWI/SNF-related matrix-associated actin-dependent regulator of chromatin subfamily A member 3-like 1-like n=1 Tax=Trifolium medium TaxID=97028 RepID=A0A392QVM2_9FABA|nr:SWI/SNF-related matrix-associated actin-dependent regulator of chromatin subfamily A member 3-like 1-like [Trifolium medium]